MATNVFRPGATALITGGGSGVGFAVAQLCRSHNMHLVLVDIHAENLAKAQTLLESSSSSSSTAKIVTHVMDVSERASWESLRDKVRRDFADGGVNMLMLNAGAMYKPGNNDNNPWEDPEYFDKTFATNIRGVLNGIATFLPMVTASAETASSQNAIIITGSKQGITNPPGGRNPAYNASKAAVKSIAEHLAHDIRTGNAGATTSATKNKNISVHLLVPGWTYTTLSGSPGPIPDEEALATKPKGAWLPSQVAKYMYEKMKEDEFYIICPDSDVDEALDKARMKWAIGDVVEGRPALSRWDEEWKDRASELIGEDAERLRSAS